jgi:hypothetical protein
MANEFKIKKGLIVTGADGGTVVDIQGSQGQLFSVTDDLSGSIFAVSDISGVPILDVNSSGLVTIDGSLTSNGVITAPSFVSSTDSGISINGITMTRVAANSAIRVSNGLETLGLLRSYDALVVGTTATIGGDVFINRTGILGSAKLSISADAGEDVLGVQCSSLNTTTKLINVFNSAGVDIASITINNDSTPDMLFNVDNGAGAITEVLKLDSSQNATFAEQAFSSATSSGDASSTLTTKGYVDSLITGATIYRGAWQAGISATSSAATTASTTLTVTAAILDADGETPDLVGAVVTGEGITGIVKVASVTSSTVYVLDTAITATATAYIFSPIYGAPSLDGVTQTSGYYYICSEAGSATPNGANSEPNTWNVGDWCIYNDVSGTGQWQKIDNSSVLSGAGTGQTVALWEGPSSVSDSDTLGNAPITVSGNDTTFAGNVTLTGGALSISGDGSNAVSFTETGAGKMTVSAADDIVLDAGSDIVLDAGGDDLRLKVSGTEYAKFNNSSSNLNIFSSIQDKAIKFIGNDNGTEITALTLNMADGGDATFAGDVSALRFDMNPGYAASAEYMSISKAQNQDGGILLKSKPTGGSGRLDWQILNHGTTGDLRFYAYGLAGNSLILDRENGNATFGGTVSSGRITVSSDAAGDSSWDDSGILIENTSTTTGEPTLAFRNAGTNGTGSNYWFTGLNQSNTYKIAYGTSFTDGNTKLELANNGALRLNAYTQGFLQTDANGNISVSGGGTLPGGPYLPLTGGTLTGELIVDESVKADAFFSHQGTYTANTHTDKWQKVYSHNWSTFSFSAFTLKVLAGGDTSNNNLNADVHINYKMQNGAYYVYANIVNYGSEALLAENFKINLSVTSAASGSWTIWHKLIKNYQTPYYTLIGSGLDGTWYNDTPVTSPTGDDDTWNERIILNSMSVDVDNSANVGIGTTAPTSLLEISKQLSAASTIDYPYTISSRDDGNSINQAGGEGVGIKFRIAGNAATTPGDSLVGASIAAIREMSGDTDSSTGLGFFVTQNDETLDEALRIDHDRNIQFNAYGAGTLVTDANGNISVSSGGGAGGPYLPLAGGRMTTTAKIEFYNATQYIHANSTNDLTLASGDDINFKSNYNRFYNGTTEYARLSGSTNSWLANGSGGKIGISTTTPVETLSVPGGEGVMLGFKRFYSDTGTVPAGIGSGFALTADLNTEQGTTLTSQYQYKFYLTTTGTGTYNSSVYIVYRNSADTAWDVHRVSATGLSSNHPELTVSGTSALIYNDHPSAYGVYYRVETSYTGQAKTSPEIFGSDYMWTRDNTDLHYMSGNVGIGTTSPDYKLDVEGDISLVSGGENYAIMSPISQGMQIAVGDPAAIATPLVTFDGSYGGKVTIQTTVGTSSLANKTAFDIQGTQGQLFSVTDDLSGDIFSVADISGVPILNVNSNGTSYFDGDVGIGTDSPGAKLEVDGNIKLSSTAGQTATPSYIWLGNDYSNGQTRDKLKIYLYNSGTEQYGFTVGNQSDIQYHSNQEHDFYVANSLKVRINQSGDVGIGVTTPDAKIHALNSGLAAKFVSSQATALEVQGGGNSQPIARFKNTAASDKVIISSTGSLGIGTTTPDTKLDVISGANNGIRISATDTSSNWRDISIRSYVTQAEAAALTDHTHFFTTNPSGQSDPAFQRYGGTVIQCRDDGNSNFAIRIGNGNGHNTALNINASGVTTFNNTVTATNFILSSDERKKTKIKDLACNNIDVNWKSFELKEDEGEYRTGVIAQELEEKHPEFVNTDDEGFKSVKYIDLLIAKIAELEARLEKAGI